MNRITFPEHKTWIFARKFGETPRKQGRINSNRDSGSHTFLILGITFGRLHPHKSGVASMKKSEFTNKKCEQVPQSVLWFLLMNVYSILNIFWICVHIYNIYIYVFFPHLLLIDRGIKTPIWFLFTGQILAARVRSIMRQPEGQENTSTMGVGDAPVVPSSRKISDENSTLSKWICLALIFVVCSCMMIRER